MKTSFLFSRRLRGPAGGCKLPKSFRINIKRSCHVTLGISLIFALTFLVCGKADTVSEKWVQRYAGPAGDYDSANACAVDTAGNVAVTGRSGSDSYTAKYRAIDGVKIWERRYHGNAGAMGSAIAFDSLGNVVISGAAWNSSGNADYYTAKYTSATGALIWEQRYNGPDNRDDFVFGIAIDAFNNVLVTGYSQRYVAGPPNQGFDSFTVKYSGVGGYEMWHHRSQDGRARSIALDSQSNVIITGAHTIKYSPNGVVLWDHTGSYSGVAVKADDLGNIVVAGTSPTNNWDYYTAKLSSATGSILWERTYNGTGNSFDQAVAIATDQQNNVIVTGQSNDVSGRSNFYTAKYSTFDGAILWDRRFIGPGNSNLNQPSALALDQSGNVVVTGSSWDLQGNGIYTAKYSSTNGNILWEKWFDGTVSSCVAITPDNRVVIAGSSNQDYFTLEYALDFTVPAITTQPQSQTTTSGGNVTFSVFTNGSPSPSFQWRWNGGNIVGATSSTLTVSNAQLANAGYYTVFVSNSVGQVTSIAAKLTVLSNLDSVTPPAQPVYSGIPARGSGIDTLVIVAHGWQPPAAPADISWVTYMANSISQELVNSGKTNWAVWPLDWVGFASTPFPDLALGNGHNVGRNLGKQIVNAGWSHVHFIAHSAGAALIQSATDYIKLQNSSITVHETFLDPYLGMHRAGVHEYGHLADWADNYFSHDTLTGGEVFSLTEGPLDYAYNVEVTWLDPTKTLTPKYGSSLSSTPSIPSGYVASSTHGWPYGFYQDTIPPIPSTRLPGYEGFGFPLSKEGGGWANRSSYVVGNMPHVLAAQNGAPQGSIPITTGAMYNFSVLAHPIGQTGLVQFNASGFTATTGGAPFGPQSIGKDGSIQTNAAAVGAPAWTSIPVDVTSNVNFVTFNAAFTSPTGAMGLLTIYWNDLEIGRIDERDVLPGVQTYTFGITGTFLDRSNSLGFRIDQFSAVASSVSVTNVATGFGGLTTPPKLKIENVSGISTPVLTVTGMQNFTYLVESSQDLVNWEPMAAVTLDTGVAAALTDSSVPGFLMRFYRVVSP